MVELIWFKGMRWIKSGIKLKQEYIVFGKPASYSSKFNIVHPEMDLLKEHQTFSAALQPVYHSTEKLILVEIVQKTSKKTV